MENKSRKRAAIGVILILGVIAIAVVLAQFSSDEFGLNGIDTERGESENLRVRRKPSPAFGTSEVTVVGDDAANSSLGNLSSLPHEFREQETKSGVLKIRVVRHDREPVSKHVISLTQYGDNGVVDSQSLTKTSDTLGEVEFPELKPGLVLVTCSPFLRKYVTIRPGIVNDIELEIPSGVTVQGRVVDFIGNPVEAARVVSWKYAKAMVLAVSKKDGTFTIHGLDHKAYYLCAFKAGFAPSMQTQVKSSRPGSVEKIELVVRKNGVHLFGRIADEDGEPVEGALVELKTTITVNGTGQGGIPNRTVQFRTSSDGKYDFECVPSGECRLIVNAVGYLGAGLDVDTHVDSRYDLRLRKGATVYGIVKDEFGDPIPGALIRQTKPAFEGSWSLGVRTNSVGGFELTGLEENSLTINAMKMGFGNVNTTIVPSISMRREWNPVLASGLKLKGRLLDMAGVPLSGWRLNVGLTSSFINGDKFLSVSGRTDSEGNFLVANCPNGELSVLLSDTKYRVKERIDGIWPSRSVIVVKFDETKLAEVNGQVDSALAGWKNAKITLSGINHDYGFFDSVTAKFGFDELPAGEYVLKVKKIDGSVVCRVAFQLQPSQKLDLGTLEFR